MKWTAFDQETASALAAHLPKVEHAQGNTDALESALDCAKNALTRDPAVNSTLVITMRTKAAAQPGSAGNVPAPQPSSYEAGGFLGLSDEPVYDDKRNR
jgi:hypothetical protein